MNVPAFVGFFVSRNTQPRQRWFFRSTKQNAEKKQVVEKEYKFSVYFECCNCGHSFSKTYKRGDTINSYSYQTIEYIDGGSKTMKCEKCNSDHIGIYRRIPWD